MVRANRSYQGKLVTNRPPEADFSKLGQAYFQGLIVSDHYVLTDNAVSVVGSLWSTGKHEATPVTIDGKTVTPGDLILNLRGLPVTAAGPKWACPLAVKPGSVLRA